MVFSLALLAARFAAMAGRGGQVASKAPIKTVVKPQGWGGISKGTLVKTGVVGGSVAAGGLGISSAVSSAQESIERGGGGLLVVGGLAIAVIIIIFMVFRGRK
jgi:hypothetical protein